MSEREIIVRVNDAGDIVAWKALVGGRRSHVMANPVFPAHQPNYSLEFGVRTRVKSYRRRTGEIPLTDEFARRK